MKHTHAQVLIVGGGTGGVAAALGAAALGCRVMLTEPTDWLGGQLTSQAVPPDENPWIEQFGCTRRWRAFRDGVRQYYRDHYPLTPAARANPRLNPGNGLVGALCHEPRVGLAVIEQMLAYDRSAGRIDVRLRTEPVKVQMAGDRVAAVTLRNVDSGSEQTISANYVLDATELGDVLALGRIEYVSGAESQKETGEPHAVAGPAQRENVQAVTWCFPMAFDPDGTHVIDKPEQYERWRSYVPKLTPAWPGKLLSWIDVNPITLKERECFLFEDQKPAGAEKWASRWWYRRIVCRDHYAAGAMPHEATLVNWPQNDYFEGNLIDKPANVVAKYIHEAKQLSLSLMYWLQTEAPRPDGGQGYPGLYLRPDMTGTEDGLAKYPYIRESRRIRAEFTVTENHVGADARGGRPAEVFADSVGIGYYRIDLHASTGGNNYIDIESRPFQIPLGALIPVRVENLLPACKDLGVTHITNGCFRLHPVEWNTGESAGLLAAFCIAKKVRPKAVREKQELLEEFQSVLRQQGIELEWPKGPW